jgi:hypothetical protein
VTNGSDIIKTGVTVVGNTTISALTFIANADENEFLGAAAGKAGAYDPLPPQGTMLEAGDMYAYAGGLVIVRQSHVRTEHAPADVPALFSVYRAGGGALEWVANERVEIGTRRMYNSVLYEAIQAHTTQADWAPTATLGVLWRAVATTPEWEVGVLYRVNDEVTYQGVRYRCRQQHTSIATWAPPVVPALWLPL